MSDQNPFENSQTPEENPSAGTAGTEPSSDSAGQPLSRIRPEGDPLAGYDVTAALTRVLNARTPATIYNNITSYMREKKFVENLFHLKPVGGSDAYALLEALEEGRLKASRVADRMLEFNARQYVHRTLTRILGLRGEMSSVLDNDTEVKQAVEDAIALSRSYVREKLTVRQIRDLVRRNRRYAKDLQAADRVMRERKDRTLRLKLIAESIKNDIPSDPAELYPEARAMKRHFVLHIGDTNSGKSHDAVQAMMHAGTGMYLAPLRLLAYENYGRLNEAGVPCTMLTGEEHIETEGARHTARTVELCDLTNAYDCVVIDEAQMIADTERGGAWTEAILGVQAPEIHLCAAPYAQNILIKVIESCGDTWEVKKHTRMTPLLPDDTEFDFPDSIREGDAMIVFTRRDVIAMGAELIAKNIPCSLIYGALPYDVRQHEVDRLASGETKVVVATDAIGMGMNLPIRRIVFCATRKFDGTEKRDLLPAEVQQIAGRAGRYGLNESGFYAAAGGFSHIHRCMKTHVPSIRRAMLGFPSRLTENGGRLSETLEMWAQASAKTTLYEKSTITRLMPMCTWLEERLKEKDRVVPEKKKLILDLIRIPFNERTSDLMNLWKDLSSVILSGRQLEDKDIAAHEPNPRHTMNLEYLELSYAICDLLFHFARSYVGRETEERLMEKKRAISEQINQVLAKQKLRRKTCRMCGRPMPWDAPARVCERCQRLYRWRE